MPLLFFPGSFLPAPTREHNPTFIERVCLFARIRWQNKTSTATRQLPVSL